MSHPDQSPDQPATGCRYQSHACLQESRTRDRSGETLPEPRAEPRVQWRSVLFIINKNKLPLTSHFSDHCVQSTFNDTSRVASRSDSSSEPPDPRGGKQPRPVCGGLHHWQTERFSSLRASPGELSVIVERGQLNTPSATPHHLRLHWQIEQWQTLSLASCPAAHTELTLKPLSMNTTSSPCRRK